MWLPFLLPACVLSMLACLRLCRAVMLADQLEAAVPYGEESGGDGLDLAATAYLAGGPDRVVDPTLVNMVWRGRLHLAHIGWTTVVHPVGRSELERSATAAIGPEGHWPRSGTRTVRWPPGSRCRWC